jgi:hypothetical protein
MAQSPRRHRQGGGQTMIERWDLLVFGIAVGVMAGYWLWGWRK